MPELNGRAFTAVVGVDVKDFGETSLDAAGGDVRRHVGGLREAIRKIVALDIEEVDVGPTNVFK